MEKQTIYQKVFEAKAYIKSLKIEKKGYNDYSNYYYFTPEQIEEMVSKACIEQRLLSKFDLIRKENGTIDGVLQIIDVDDSKQSLTWTMATDIPSIKATNIVQQLGGAMTFTERYLKQTAFGIMDNTLDFDSKNADNSAKESKPKDDRAWLNEGTDDWDKVMKAIEDGKVKDLALVKTKYKINKVNAIAIQDYIKEVSDGSK